MKLSFLCLIIFLSGCNSASHFEAVYQSPNEAISGDIIIVSGGAVASTVSPFPLHKISLFSDQGEFKKFLYQAANVTEFLYGGDIDTITKDFIFTVETVDRVDRVDLNSFNIFSEILDGNLNGTTMKAITNLSDGSSVIAESPTVIEKYSSAGVRAGAPFPITLPTAINNLKRISGDRFIATFTTNPDSPRVYNNNGTLAATFPTTSPCTTNCDPYDVVELSDGRFAVNSRITHGIYLYAANLTYVGVLYLDPAIINMPSSMTLLDDGKLLVCNTSFNTCERLAISGNTATRVGSTAFINDVSKVRQPTSVVVVP
jgi:hypothetical protein